MKYQILISVKEKKKKKKETSSAEFFNQYAKPKVYLSKILECFHCKIINYILWSNTKMY